MPGICLHSWSVTATGVAARALERVSAQLSTSARGGGHLARRGLGSAPAGQFDGWAASVGSCGPVVVPGVLGRRPIPGWALSSIRSADLKNSRAKTQARAASES